MSNNLRGVHFHFFEHFISFKSLLKLSSRQKDGGYHSTDGKKCSSWDLRLVEDKDCKLDFAGTMDLKRVLEIVKEKVMEQKSCDVSTWIPSKLQLPASLEQVFKAPDLLKKTANSYIALCAMPCQ